jgi:N-dimethylarginine dimethylaminohydrolase
MCRPDYFEVDYEINPWMNVNKKADHNAAVNQWEILYKSIKNCGAQVDLVQPVVGWPDMVFTANAGLFYENKLIMSHFKYKERQGEIPYYKTWFTQAGFEIINNNTPTSPFFEGAGDALSAGGNLFAGYGFRSDLSFYEQASYLNHNKIIFCELTDPYFYHLDTCFCPLNDNLAIWYPQAFTKESQKSMAENIELIPVVEEEAKRFACNAVVINNNVILPNLCPQISAALKERNYITHACDMTEFLKSGGACKCLTLRID